MRFSPNDLANLAQMKSMTGDMSSARDNTPMFDSTPVPETNQLDPGNIGQTFNMPTVPGSLTPVGNPRAPASVPGVSDYIMDRVNNGAYNMNLASITHGNGATRDALVNAGYGDWVKGAYERAMDERAAHYAGNGSQNAMDTAQLGWYNDRYGTYGGQQAQTQPVGQPMPALPAGAGVRPEDFGLPPVVTSENANAIANWCGTNNIDMAKLYDQDNTQFIDERNYNSAATRRASGMFNGLTGVTNTVRGINGQQPTPLQYTQMQQPPQQQPQESPNWGQNTNPATAGSPPSHGGSNPGYSGMMTNTADTMAALKALIANLSRR